MEQRSVVVENGTHGRLAQFLEKSLVLFSSKRVSGSVHLFLPFLCWRISTYCIVGRPIYKMVHNMLIK